MQCATWHIEPRMDSTWGVCHVAQWRGWERNRAAAAVIRQRYFSDIGAGMRARGCQADLAARADAAPIVCAVDG